MFSPPTREKSSELLEPDEWVLGTSMVAPGGNIGTTAHHLVSEAPGAHATLAHFEHAENKNLHVFFRTCTSANFSSCPSWGYFNKNSEYKI